MTKLITEFNYEGAYFNLQTRHEKLQKEVRYQKAINRDSIETIERIAVIAAHPRTTGYLTESEEKQRKLDEIWRECQDVLRRNNV